MCVRVSSVGKEPTLGAVCDGHVSGLTFYRYIEKRK